MTPAISLHPLHLNLQFIDLLITGNLQKALENRLLTTRESIVSRELALYTYSQSRFPSTRLQFLIPARVNTDYRVKRKPRANLGVDPKQTHKMTSVLQIQLYSPDLRVFYIPLTNSQTIFQNTYLLCNNYKLYFNFINMRKLTFKFSYLLGS